MIFTRSFVGINIFGFRIGEIEVLVGLLICLIFFVLPLSKSKKNSEFYNTYFKLIVISFFLVLFITSSNPASTYTYKSSSYIWTVGFIYLGIISSAFIKNQKKIKYLPSFIPFIIYIFNTGNYPDFIINFFKEYSDKFQFTKASDIFLCIIAIYFYLEKVNSNKDYKVLYIFFYVPIFLPMLIILSRGSYVGIIIFSMIALYYEREYILNNKLKIFIFSLISLGLFVFSTFRVSGTNFFAQETITPEIVTEQIKQNNEVKDTKKAFLTFYISEGRLFSKDETTNWRLDIWQDVIHDMVSEKNIFYGYGYNSIIPQMTDPTAPGRLGRDGLNENVHNYFVTILSRGGLFQLVFFILFHLTLINIWVKNEKNYKILIFYLPAMFVSFLDISMDGVQFPLIFYSSLGFYLAE